MIQSPAGAQSFYADRNSRTNVVSGQSDYTRARIALSIGHGEAESPSGQVTFLLAANLLARWCRCVRLIAPRGALLHPHVESVLAPQAGTVADGGLQIAHAADPYGDFAPAATPASADYHLHVAGDVPLGAYPIAGRGWLALCGDAVGPPRQGDDSVLIGAVLAACVGSAQAFRAVLGLPLLGPVRLSLWNLRGGTAAMDGPRFGRADLGHVYLIGCGAVGSTIAYLLPLIRLTGILSLVDRDLVDASNLNRAPLFTFADISRQKTEVAAAHLRRAGIVVHEYPEWFDDAVAAGRIFNSRPDLVVPTANDRGVRHAIQHQVPPLQIYGTTGRNWDAFLGRHIPLKEDCIACRFPAPRPEAEPPLACATGRIPAPMPESNEAADAALPFLSTAAAALAVAELMKAALDSYPANPNFACLDLRGNMNDVLVYQRPPDPTCTCAAQRTVWSRLNGRSRFAKFRGWLPASAWGGSASSETG